MKSTEKTGIRIALLVSILLVIVSLINLGETKATITELKIENQIQKELIEQVADKADELNTRIYKLEGMARNGTE